MKASQYYILMFVSVLCVSCSGSNEKDKVAVSAADRGGYRPLPQEVNSGQNLLIEESEEGLPSADPVEDASSDFNFGIGSDDSDLEGFGGELSLIIPAMDQV